MSKAVRVYSLLFTICLVSNLTSLMQIGAVEGLACLDYSPPYCLEAANLCFFIVGSSTLSVDLRGTPFI